LGKAVEFVSDAVREAVRDAFVDDVNTIGQDSVGVVQGDLRTISLGQHWDTFSLLKIPDDKSMVRCQSIAGKRWARNWEESGGWGHGLGVCEAVGPEDQSDPVDGASPPCRTNVCRHASDQPQ